jgi:hypothetical protein
VVEKPIVATLPQIEKLNALLANPDAASRVLALDHWMARIETVKQGWSASLTSSKSKVFQEPSGFNAAGNPSRLTLPPASRIRVRFATRMA